MLYLFPSITVTPHLIVAQLKSEEEYKANHRGVHSSPYNLSAVMERNNGHNIICNLPKDDIHNMLNLQEL